MRRPLQPFNKVLSPLVVSFGVIRIPYTLSTGLAIAALPLPSRRPVFFLVASALVVVESDVFTGKSAAVCVCVFDCV